MFIKSIFFYFLFFIFPLNCNCQFSLNWVRSIGDGGNFKEYKVIGTDKIGNTYTTGLFNRRLIFDPKNDTIGNINNTMSSCFITKYDYLGNLIWVKSIEGIKSSNCIVISSKGDVFFCGSFSDTVDFNPDSNVFNLVAIGNSDIFICKLDSLGNFIWAKSFEGTNNKYSDANSMCIDNNDNIVIAGQFEGTVDFDPNNGTNFLTSLPYLIPTLTAYDIFVCKLSSNSNLVWVKQIGGNSYESVSSILLDNQNNIYYSGRFDDSVDFNPGISIHKLFSNSPNNLFISNLDSLGNFLWVKQIRGEAFTELNSLDIDLNNNLYLTGGFHDSIVFDYRFKNILKVSNSFKKISSFICKFDLNGNFKWAQQLDSKWNILSSDIGVKNLNEIVICGSFSDSVDFGLGGIPHFFYADNYTDLFILKVDSLGFFKSVNVLGGYNSEGASAINYNISGELNLIGTFYDVFDIDPSKKVYNLVPRQNKYSELFLLKLKDCLPTFSFKVVSSCNNFISPSKKYIWTKSGIYFDTIVNKNGCDSIIKLTLSIDTLKSKFTLIGKDFVSSNSNVNFQWITCNPLKKIVLNANNNTYRPALAGAYGLIVSNNKCIDTSVCIFYNILNLSIMKEENINLYPNPVKDLLEIEKFDYIKYKIIIKDIKGKQVYQGILSELITKINTNLFKGLYFVEISNINFNKTFKIIINE